MAGSSENQMNLVVKRAVQMGVALAIPLMAQTVWAILVEVLLVRPGPVGLLGTMVAGVIAGLLAIRRFFSGRWWRGPLALLYVGVMPVVLLYYSLILEVYFACHGYEGPPGGCWP